MSEAAHENWNVRMPDCNLLASAFLVRRKNGRERGEEDQRFRFGFLGNHPFFTLCACS